jgi:hypothetical protein
VLLSVNCTFSDTAPDVGEADKAATGTADFAETVIRTDVELEPFLLLAIKLTVYVPTFVNWCTGFFCVEVFPSPKFQDHEVGEPVLLSVNVTLNGAIPVVEDALIAATGITVFAETVI